MQASQTELTRADWDTLSALHYEARLHLLMAHQRETKRRERDRGKDDSSG